MFNRVQRTLPVSRFDENPLHQLYPKISIDELGPYSYVVRSAS